MAVLLAGGSFGVHQLRFLLAFGSRSGDVLAREGHAYLTAVWPLLLGALAVVAAQFAAALARGAKDGGHPAFRRVWFVSSATLLALYCAQELGEGILFAGHAAGFAGTFAAGGWLSAPLAVAVGLVIALLMRSAVAVVRFVSARRAAARPKATAPGRRRLADAVLAPSTGLLCLAGPRAPPAPPRG